MRHSPFLSLRSVRRRLRVRSVLLLALLVPLVGIATLAGILVHERWSDRQASTRLEAETAEMSTTLELVAAVAEEEARSTMIGLVNDFDLSTGAFGLDAELEAARLEGARARVDGSRLADARLGIDFDRLRGLRADLDAGTSGYASVDEVFHRLNGQLESRWRTQMDDIDKVADSQPLTSGTRHRLRTLRESMEALDFADERVHEALQILIGTPSNDTVERLVALNTEFRASVDRSEPDPGTLTAAMWAQFNGDPAAQRTEDIIDAATRIGLDGQPTSPVVDLPELSQALTDGARWGDLLADVVTASARDLQSSAAAQADADTQAATVALVLAVLLELVSFGLAVAIARNVARPARDLEDAARRVASGEFDLPALQPHGPRELAATVDAFNDMAATLAAVEDHAVALAENPNDPVLSDPLPGRTGQAMQVALDRLLGSIRETEKQKVALAELATHDGLTGLLNQTAVLEAVDQEMARARRDGTELLALYVDLDWLKHLNDTYGHAVGDTAIRRTADALIDTTREGDITARLGGDEFLIVCRAPDEGPEAAELFAERVRDRIGAQTIDLTDGTTFPLQCSVGIAMSTPDISSAHGLINAADVALYRAKQAGRGRVAWGTGIDLRTSTTSHCAAER